MRGNVVEKDHPERQSAEEIQRKITSHGAPTFNRKLARAQARSQRFRARASRPWVRRPEWLQVCPQCGPAPEWSWRCPFGRHSTPSWPGWMGGAAVVFQPLLMGTPRVIKSGCGG